MRGFSLIELMISVAIVAILAVLAFPAYQDYAVRSRKSEGLVLATEAKNVVTENAATSGADLGLGYVGLHTATRNVRAIQVNSLNGIVTVEFGEAAGGGAALAHSECFRDFSCSWSPYFISHRMEVYWLRSSCEAARAMPLITCCRLSAQV
nr:pilin [Xanthomonas populi]